MKTFTVLVFLLALVFGSNAIANAESFHTQANVMVEIPFHAKRTHADAFNDVALDVVFVDPQGSELRVPGFWAGTNLWKVRYASPVTGTHRFRSECSDATDKGLQGITGGVVVAPYTGTNALFIHGPLRVSENHRYLEHRDGTPFFWLGDTWWMGLSHRMHWPEDFQKLAVDRKQKGFNVIQIVAGLYPDMFPFDPRGANEAGYPWETNYARIRPQYFDAVDRRLEYLVDEGFTPCLVGAWGYFMPWMGVEKMKQHWRYLIARYGALPVVWCAAGEANLPWYLAKGFPYDDRKQVSQWTEVMRYMREIDPYHRLITIHPTGIGRLSARNATDDLHLIDIDMLQTPHGQREAVPPTVNTVRQSYADAPVMPVIDGEASYEMLGGVIASEWTRQMFWLCLMNGAAGHTYGANGIWQVNRRGDPHGASPHGGNYGTIPWDEAMNLPASRQVGLGKKLLEEYPWQQFQPHPQWAEFAGMSVISLKDANWIWYPEGNPAQNAPAEKRYFRKAIVMPAGKTVKTAKLRVLVDDKFEARLNGEKIGGANDWHAGRQFNELAKRLKPRTNILVIEAENMPAGGPDPAGLIASLVVQFADGETLKMNSDATWSCNKRAAAGWDTAAFDESGWKHALVEGKYGAMPWGLIEPPTDGAYEPQSAGIPGVVRITYVPQSRPILVKELAVHGNYYATYFDPVTGVKAAIGLIHPNEAGTWTCPAPQNTDHDWVLILEEQKSSAIKRNDGSHHLALANDKMEWDVDWSDGNLRSWKFANKISGHQFALEDSQELALNFSPALDRVAQPFLRVTDFEVRAAHRINSQEAVFELHSSSPALDVKLHFKLEGSTRRKWVEVNNQSGKELLLLDAELDNFVCDGRLTGGGMGQPVFIEDECFAAIEHPSGMNNIEGNRVKLLHHPGHRLAPGATWKSEVALVSVAPAGKAFDQFLAYIQSKSRRGEKVMSIYTPFGINNQWGGCPTLDDEETLDVLNVVERLQKRGAHFDYFTLDTGWVDPNSDLTRFRPTCYPNGPGEIIKRVNSLGMKFGLWYPTSWEAESCWDYPPALAGQTPISMSYRLGYPERAHQGQLLCMAQPAIFQTLSNAVIYAIQKNHVRFVKLDGGSYVCARTDHQHLPGVYATEQMHNELISLMHAARAIVPNVKFMLYYGCYSPFWALHGDFIFESGVPMEGSATSAYPTLYYRDSVTLMQDEVAQYARSIPPLIKDSLGVWLADNRWGNFMGKERWRESLVMDLGRGNLLFPNLWGDLYQLDDPDADFLGKISKLARDNERLFAHRRNILGDPWHNDVYGYAYCQGAHGWLFVNNASFVARHAEVPLSAAIGLDAGGQALNVISHFPDRTRLLRPDGAGFKCGDMLSIWLRPFEVLMLEVTPSSHGIARLPLRQATRNEALGLGVELALKLDSLEPHLDVQFADAARFQQMQMSKKSYAFEAQLPAFEEEESPVLAVTVQLRQGGKEWRYKPVVCEIVQAVAKIHEQDVQFIPVPDGRQFGNTQSFGSSWVTYETRLGKLWSGKKLKLAVHAYLPAGVEAQVQAFVVKRWWNENARPAADGYYNDAPS